jgi:hypothetical protein
MFGMTTSGDSLLRIKNFVSYFNMFGTGNRQNWQWKLIRVLRYNKKRGEFVNHFNTFGMTE